jgi:hypothetical protein
LVGVGDDPAGEVNAAREIRMFCSFLVLVSASVLTVIVASTRWRTESWVALGAVGACLQALGVLGAVGYASGQLAEARRLRLEQVRPLVAIDVAYRYFGQIKVLMLEIVNQGQLVAKDVNLVFDPPLARSGELPTSSFPQGGILTLVPGRTWSRGIERTDLEFLYKVRVTYKAHDGRTFEEDFSLDNQGIPEI